MKIIYVVYKERKRKNFEYEEYSVVYFKPFSKLYAWIGFIGEDWKQQMESDECYIEVRNKEELKRLYNFLKQNGFELEPQM